MSLTFGGCVNRLTGSSGVGRRDLGWDNGSWDNSSGLVVQLLGSHRRSVAMRASTRTLGFVHLSADVAQPVELLFCKQEVRGSSPLVSSSSDATGLDAEYRRPRTIARGELLDQLFEFSEGCPSGQWEQAVNLPAYAFGGSNPPPSTDFLNDRCKADGNIEGLGWQAGSDGAIGRAPFCGSSSAGRASAFQAERRGFESRLPLRTKCQHVFAIQRLAPSVCPPSSDGRARPW